MQDFNKPMETINISDTNNLLKFWFPNSEFQKWWFISNSQLDLEIYQKFYNKMVELFNSFNITNYTNSDKIKLITDIILLDQISRNISRVIEQIDIPTYTEKAELLANIWISEKYYLTEPIEHTVFALLPIRHTKNKVSIKKLIPVLDEIKNINSNESNPIYVKFYTHTLRALK